MRRRVHRKDPNLVVIEFAAGRFLRKLRPAAAWKESILPPSGILYLAADGLGSSSTSQEFSKVTPWIEVVKPIIEEVDPRAAAYGFSYYRPGFHYGPENTLISLLVDTPTLFQSYASSFDTNQVITYLGFSLGASLLTLGLGQFIIGLGQQTIAGQISKFVPALIMVQPAIALADSYVEAAKKVDERKLRGPLAEFLTDGTLVQSRFMECVQAMVSGGVKVYMIYWERDQFIAYPQTVLDRMRQLKVVFRPLHLNLPVTTDPFKQFQQHCDVAHHDETRKEIRAVLALVS